MGAGKSFIGKRLAGFLNFYHIDTDALIENIYNLPINKIFSKYGEHFFRQQETFVLKKILSDPQNAVVSVGGGLPCFNNNLQMIKSSGISFYLKLPPQILFERLVNLKTDRPLIRNLPDPELKNYIEKLLGQREKNCYEKADFILNACKNPEQIIKDIVRNLNSVS